MALQFRKVTEADRLTITPIIGEPLYSIDTRKLYIGDGVTIGGVNVVSNITVKDYLDVDLDEEDLEDGSFIYYAEEENRWRIGKPSVSISELQDVDSPDEIENNFILVYDQATEKWIIREPLSRGIGDVEEFVVSEGITDNSVLQYNEELEKFESQTLPPRPTIGSLMGVETLDTQRGHLLFYRGAEEGFVNDWINSSDLNPYYVNLYNLQNLDIIKWNEENERFERYAPSLTDANLISLEGLNESEPDDIIFTVTLSENNRFAIDTSVAPELFLFRDRNYVFNLSDPSLLGKTFQISDVLDGTNSLDPPGEIYVNNRITLTGTPGIDGELRFDLRTSDLDGIISELYYFCVEEPEFGNGINIGGNFPLQPFVMQWDSDLSSFNSKRFAYSIGEFGDVELTNDPEAGIPDFQMLAWDSGNRKWTTPLDRVAGVGIGGGLPRTFNLITAALWSGGVQGLGTFNLDLKDGQELKSITINLDELEIEGQEESFDAYFFDTEEEREAFQKALEDAERIFGELSREAIDEIADGFNAKKARLQSNRKAYTRAGKGTAARGNVEVSGDGTLAGGTGSLGSLDGLTGLSNFGPLDFGGLGGSGGGGEGTSEPGLDDLTTSIPNPEEEAEAFKDAYKNFGNNLKKVFGALVARNKLLEELYPEGIGGKGGIEIEAEVVDPVSDPIPPTMLGWRASTDVYGYYYFTFTERASVLTFNSRDHYLIVQSYMRRCGCILDRGSTFKVVFYYDADDSRYMAGEWLRIVEYQKSVNPYSGELQEFPSTTIRQDLEEWNPVTKYIKGNRVIYDDKVWELTIESSEASAPQPGTTLAPTTVEGRTVEAFVEIPAFSVKSQLFEGVYQLRCTLGKDTEGGKTHPVFSFGEPSDNADFVYIGCNLIDQNGFISSLNNSSFRNIRLDTKTGHKQFLNSKNLDIGVFLYDMNVHSALQHLMVQEYQTFNIEKSLGECRLGPTVFQSSNERSFALDCGNSSATTQEGNAQGLPAGIVNYRGIFRPYGNQGYFIDGINVNSSDGSAYINKDSNAHSDGAINPPGYIFIDKVPKPSLDAQGNGSGFISNFHIWKSQQYVDFVYLLPKSIGGSRTNFLGDAIKFRGTPASTSLLTTSTGSPFQSPIDALVGGNGPFNLNLQPLSGSNHIFGARACVKRRGASLKQKTEKIGEKQLGTIFDADGVPIATNVEESQVQPGQTFVFEKTVDIVRTVPGNDRLSGEAGTATTSAGRKLASKSAICIAVIDESDSATSLFRNVEFSEKFKNFRSQYPNRQHWLLMPCTTNPELTKPFPDSSLENNSFTFFPNITPVRPTSRNQRTSDNLTYRTKRVMEWASKGFIPDPEAFQPQSQAIAQIATNYRYARFKGSKKRSIVGQTNTVEEVTTDWREIGVGTSNYLQLGGSNGCVFGCAEQDGLPIGPFEPQYEPAVGQIPWRSAVKVYQQSGCGGGDLALGGIGFNSNGCGCFIIQGDNTPMSFGCMPVGSELEINGIWEFTNDTNEVQAQSPAWDIAPLISSWHPKLLEYGVWTYDPWNGWLRRPQDLGFLFGTVFYRETTLEPNYTYTIKYKIRIPWEIPLLAFEFTGANEMTVKLRHPTLNNGDPIVIGSHDDPSSINQVQMYPDTNFPGSTILNPQARKSVSDNNQWYDLIVEVKNTTTKTQYWVNPMSYYLRITGGNLIGTEYNDVTIFDASDYASIQSDIYNPILLDNAETPISYMRDSHLGEGNHGPYLVTRDGGSTFLTTDWFKLCRLDEASPGTIVGLFVDTSGSMTLSTVAASYNLFYQRCAENGLQISEVQNGDEDWILPFTEEI